MRISILLFNNSFTKLFNLFLKHTKRSYANVSNIVLILSQEIRLQLVSLTFKFHIIAKIYFGHSSRVILQN